MKACIASASYDLTVRVWDVNTRAQLITIPHPESQINCLAFVPNPNGGPDVDHIAIGSWQKLKVFDITQSQPVICPSFEGASKNITACGFSLPNVHGSWMFTGGDDGHVRIFDTKPIVQRQHIQALTCHNALEIGSPITSVVLHLNQIELFIADQSGRVHIWDLSKQVNTEIYTPKLGMFEFVVKLAVHPVVTSAGTILSGITNRGRLLSWRLTQNEVPMSISGSGYDVDSLDLKTTTNAAYLGIASLDTERKKNRIGLGVSYTRDGQYLVVTFADSDVNWYNSDDFPNYDKHPNFHFNTESDWNWEAIVTSDNKYMFTGGSDGRIKIWEVETQKLYSKMEGHQKGISAMTVSE